MGKAKTSKNKFNLTEKNQNGYLFNLTEKIQDIINGYNTMMVLANTTEDIIDINSNIVFYSYEDVVTFKSGRITVKNENEITINIKCDKERINEVNAIVPLLKCGKKWIHISDSVLGYFYICSIDLKNDNQQYILDDIRSLMSCVI